MGIKLEIILSIAILLTILATTTVKLSNTAANDKVMSKELEFNDTTFIEVNQKKIIAKLYSTYGVRNSGILTLNNLKYHTNNIEQLIANKGHYKENILYLDGNVELKEKEGFIYTTEHANYNQKTEILRLTSPFIAQMDKNIMHGHALEYHALKKEMNATGIAATVYTVEK